MPKPEVDPAAKTRARVPPAAPSVESELDLEFKVKLKKIETLKSCFLLSMHTKSVVNMGIIH